MRPCRHARKRLGAANVPTPRAPGAGTTVTSRKHARATQARRHHASAHAPGPRLASAWRAPRATSTQAASAWPGGRGLPPGLPPGLPRGLSHGPPHCLDDDLRAPGRARTRASAKPACCVSDSRLALGVVLVSAMFTQCLRNVCALRALRFRNVVRALRLRNVVRARCCHHARATREGWYLGGMLSWRAA